MTYLLRISLAIALGLLLAHRATAQESAYQFTPPAGWNCNFVGNNGYCTPPSTITDAVGLSLLPAQPSTSNLDQDIAPIIKRWEQSMGHKQLQFTQTPLNSSARGEVKAYLGAYATKEGKAVLAVFFARVEKGMIGTVVLVAAEQEAIQRHLPVTIAMFESLHMKGSAGKPAAGTGGSGAQVQPQTPPQAQVQAQTQPQAQASAQPTGRQVIPGTAPAEGPAIANLSQNGQPVNASLRDLMGIWVGETAYRNESISFGTRTDSWGTSYNTMTYSFSSPLGTGGQYLKVYSDGSYEFFHNFVLGGCGKITKHSGSAVILNGLLALRPTSGHESAGGVSPKTHCETYDRDTNPPAASYKVEIDVFDTAFGYPTYRLRLANTVNSGNYYVFDRLDVRPQPAVVPPMTRAYTPGTIHPGGDLVGTWVAPDDTPADFGANSPDDGKYHAVLRLFANGHYQLISRRPDAIFAPVCGRHLQLVEEGEALFGGQINPNDNTSENGAMTLKPQKSQLFAEVRNCGSDNRKAIYDLSSGPRYFRWTLKMQRPVMAGPLPGDKFGVVCPDVYERANSGPWTFLACPEKAGQVYSGYTRR